jgi:enoyl-CoA hydratase
VTAFEPIHRPAGHPLVSLEILEGSIAFLTLCDTDRRNTLRIELSLDLEAAVTGAMAAGVDALVLAATPPVFCSGGDLDDLVTPRASLSDIARGTEALVNAPVPTIAVVEGAVIGAGINLPLACDVILCTPEASFDPRLLDLGIHPGGGQLRNLALRIGRQGAAALSLLGDRLTGVEAAEVGLAWRCVPAPDITELAMSFAQRAASRPHEAMRRAKQTLDATMNVDRETAVAIELAQQQWSIEQAWILERVDLLREKLAHRRSD